MDKCRSEAAISWVTSLIVGKSGIKRSRRASDPENRTTTNASVSRPPGLVSTVTNTRIQRMTFTAQKGDGRGWRQSETVVGHDSLRLGLPVEVQVSNDATGVGRLSE